MLHFDIDTLTELHPATNDPVRKALASSLCCNLRYTVCAYSFLSIYMHFHAEPLNASADTLGLKTFFVHLFFKFGHFHATNWKRNHLIRVKMMMKHIFFVELQLLNAGFLA